jgi:hypothetical protein
VESDRNLSHFSKPSSEPGSSVPYLFWTLVVVGEHVAEDVVLAAVVVDLVPEVDLDQPLSPNNSSCSFSEAPLEDDDNQAGAPVAPS